MTPRETREILRQTREILRRLGDYDRVDFTEKRDRLVALWRKHHPEAAQEKSSALKPLILLGTNPHPSQEKQCEPHEVWSNDTYQVTVRRFENDTVFGSRGGMVQLGISSLDGTARHDWRDFQAIKNQLCGPETEAFELYPADSRLLDPSNYYTLWCFPGVKQIKVGWGSEWRQVLDAESALAPQRALPNEL